MALPVLKYSKILCELEAALISVLAEYKKMNASIACISSASSFTAFTPCNTTLTDFLKIVKNPNAAAMLPKGHSHYFLLRNPAPKNEIPLVDFFY